MDMRHTIRGDTQGIIARTITSFTINHTMPMSMAIILRTTPMAITIARPMATIIVVTIATVMATDERTIAQTGGVMAAARTGDIDAQASFPGRGPDTRLQPGQPAAYVTGALSDRDQATTRGLCGSTRLRVQRNGLPAGYPPPSPGGGLAVNLCYAPMAVYSSCAKPGSKLTNRTSISSVHAMPGSVRTIFTSF
jgi:hypothetical protein